MAADPPLLRLPQELLLRISIHLTTPELGRYRCTCKQVEASVFDSFAREFFTRRQFMIEYVSLKALVDIANHPTLSSRLTEVIISTHTFPPRLDDDFSPLNNPSALYHLDRGVLLETGMASNMLVEAFSKLRNLRTIGLRDYNAAGRFRDGETARWRSYGWSFGSRNPQLFSNYITNLFALVVSALGFSQARPSSIKVFLRNERKLTPTSFEPLSGPLGTHIGPVLANLKTLMLSLGVLAYGRPGFGVPWQPYDRENTTEEPLRRFLRSTPNLETLRVNFEYREFFASRFLTWLGEPISNPSNFETPPIPLTNLRHFELGMANATGTTLLQLLTRFNLRSFSLWKFALHCPDPNGQTATDKDCWAHFLRELGVSLPNRVKSILIGHVFQKYFAENTTGNAATPICFVPEGTNPDETDKVEKLYQVRYSAAYDSDAKTWLAGLAKRTCIAQKDGNSPSSEENESHEESDGTLSGEDDTGNID